MADRNVRLITKRTSVSGKIPTGTTAYETNYIRSGELASNLADRALWGYDGTNVFEYGSSSFFGLTGGTVSGNVQIIGNLSADTIYSGGTDLYDIFLTTADGNDITRVQPGTNVSTGGTGNYPTVNLIDSPSFNNITFSGTANGGDVIADSMSATTLSASTIYSGTTNLSSLFLTQSGALWSASTGTDSIIANNDTGNIASGLYAVAIGVNTEANAYCSIAEGRFSTASGAASHAEGNLTIANGDSSHAEGSNTIASVSYSHAEGLSTQSNGTGSHAEGNTTQSNGQYSHAEGKSTMADGKYSHSEGNSTWAIGFQSHAEGNLTHADGDTSHAEGNSTTASGENSHSGGLKTIASGLTSFINGASGGTVSGTRSAILGGQSLTNIYNDTLMTQNLRAAENGGVIYSGGTDLYDIFLTTADGNDITRVQPGTNVSTGGTGNYPTVNLVDSPSFNNITFSGTANGGDVIADSMSATTLSASTIYSGTTNLSSLFLTQSGALWSASTGTDSIIANNGTGNLASGNYSFAEGQSNIASGLNSSIIGGSGNTASGSYSSIIGGSGLTNSVDETVMIPNLDVVDGVIVESLSGTTDRFAEVDSGGTVSATRIIIEAYILSGSTAAGYLNDTTNWNINGIYTGTTITNTYQGQKHYNDDYFFEAVDDNNFIRLIRG